jgi:hypothetical protein
VNPNSTVPTVPPPPPNPTKSPLGRYLLHPGEVTTEVLHAIAHLLLHFALGASVAAAVVLVVVLVAAMLRHQQISSRQVGGRTLRILPPPEVDPAGAEVFWTNLVALLRPPWRRFVSGQPHVAFELVATEAGLDVRVFVPAGVPPGLVEQAAEAAWPGARTTTSEALPPLPCDAPATGGALRLSTTDWYPIRSDQPVDPLRSLLGAMGSFCSGEAACVQVLARPVTGRRLARLGRAARWRRAGEPMNRLGRLSSVLATKPHRLTPEFDPTRGRDVADILEKAARPCWAVAVRYGVASTSTDAAASAVLRGRAHAIASAFALFSGRNRFDRHRLHRPARALAQRRLGRGDLLGVAELAALAHLPMDTSIPGLRRAGAKPVAAAPNVSRSGKVLGDTEAGERRPVAIGVADARYHAHVLGATGSGKSTLLCNLALGDIEEGRGVVVIDPKGDLVTDILERYPRAKAPVLIDPDDLVAPPVLNVLSGGDAELVTDNLVGIFRRIFEAYWGPRTDDVLRAACLTLLRHGSSGGAAATLADVPRLLSDHVFRAARTAQLHDEAGLGGFWSWYEDMSDAQRSQVIGPVMNKLRAFLLRDFVRKLVGSPVSSFSMDKHVLNGGTCLVRVPKGILGEETARLLGSFVVAQVWQAATARARQGQSTRVDAALYIDEAQNFLTLPRSYEEMLAEARGYGLSLVLAHQHLAQLPRELRDALSANARNKVYFNCSPEDAHVLQRHVTPELNEHDLSHLGAFQTACRLVVRGENSPAFTCRTRPARPSRPERAAAVRKAARVYGKTDAQRKREALAVLGSDGRRHSGDRSLDQPGDQSLDQL